MDHALLVAAVLYAIICRVINPGITQ